MYKLILFMGICSAFVLGSKLKTSSKDSEKMVGCYYTINAPYNDPQLELEEKGINASLCNYIFYRFAGIGSNGTLKNLDPVSVKEFSQFQHSKGHWKKNPHVKTLAHMEDFGGNYRENVLADSNLRRRVVNNVVNFVKKYQIDGIVLDLQDTQLNYGHTITPIDKKNLVLLLKALKEEFDKEDFILSVSVDPTVDIAEKAYDIKGISTYVKFINLVAFNLHTTLDDPRNPRVRHTSPLYHSSKENEEERKQDIDYIVTYWTRKGASANKLVLGTSFSSGTSYTLENEKQIGRGAPYTHEGQHSFAKYSEICAWSRKPGWKYLFDEEQQVAYLYKGDQIIPYDDVASMKAKAEFVNKMKLGGAVAMDIDEDDVSGKCGEKFALLKALNQVLRKYS